MLTSRHALFSVLLLLLLSCDLSASDPKLRDTARQVRSKYQDVVVTVEITLGDPDKKKEISQTETVTGTVLTADGLTVTAFFDIAGDAQSDVKMILPSGRKITAEVVGRDEKHHLAFLMPTLSEKVKDHPHLKLPSKRAEVDLLDDMLLLYRVSGTNRVGVCVCHVTAEGDKKGNPPVLDLGEQALGGPVFDSTGRAIGIVAASGTSLQNMDAVIQSGAVIEAELKRIRSK